MATSGKGGLISKGILSLVPLPTKGEAENLNFPPIKVNNVLKVSAQESDLALFVGNATKVKKKPSEIKTPLA